MNTNKSPINMDQCIYIFMNKNLYNELEQNTRIFLNNLQQKGGPPIYTLSPDDARTVLSRLQASIPVKQLPAIIENRIIPGGHDAKDVSITIVRPPESINETLPVIMFFHGGGWVLGGFDTHERLVRELANNANAAIVFVNYTPSPEAKYPVSLEQAYAASKWVAENGQAIHVDSSRLAVVGDSVGGNMAAAFTLLAQERGGPSIRFQVLFYPVTDASFDTSSYMKYQEGYWLTREAMKWFWSNYISDQTNRNEPKVSPLQASLDSSRGCRRHLSSMEKMTYCAMKAKPMPVSYWRLAYALLQFDIMVPSTTL